MGIVTADLAISLDGFVAGPQQSLDKPMGEGVDNRLHNWMFDEPEQNADALAGMQAAKAYVMGRNMFGPIRGKWTGNWEGWWGAEPPYHAPVFVLTHYPRESLTMEGGTSFTFVTDGIESALNRALQAAGDGDVAIGGGAQTVRQYLAAGLIDELRLHQTPAVLGAGERLLDGLTGLQLELLAVTGNHLVSHQRYRVVK
ncbi:dihydrofolate reductase family protein [Psychromicrobium sp. YIM B11713]|uniref:dihydrofolate reductase family protein n=1 Tax=Psychromicrobium sp. YIM B11713 TaxID=3145233 RepID=UPI00374FCD5D